MIRDSCLRSELIALFFYRLQSSQCISSEIIKRLLLFCFVFSCRNNTNYFATSSGSEEDQIKQVILVLSITPGLLAYPGSNCQLSWAEIIPSCMLCTSSSFLISSNLKQTYAAAELLEVLQKPSRGYLRIYENSLPSALTITNVHSLSNLPTLFEENQECINNLGRTFEGWLHHYLIFLKVIISRGYFLVQFLVQGMSIF